MPCKIQAMQLDWLLEDADEDDKQPLGINLLTAIYQSSDSQKYYKLPAVRALIRFFYRKLTDYEKQWTNALIQVFDLVQVLFQAAIMNNLILRVTDQEDFSVTDADGQEVYRVQLEDLDWENEVLKFERNGDTYFW